MNYIDLHCDTATLIFKEKVELSRNNLSIDIEKLQKGEAMAQFFAMYIDSKTVKSSFDYCKDMIKTFREEIDKNQDTISLCRDYRELEEANRDGKIGAFLTIEEGEALEGDLDRLYLFKELGISLITLVWNYENSLGYPNFEWKYQNMGLKPKGIEAIRMMNELNMIIDVSHLSDGGFNDVLKHSTKPFIASHSNARAITNNPRNLTDSMLKQLANIGGVTGINFFNKFLSNRDVEIGEIDDMVQHIKHIRNIAGVEVISIGSDFDGIPNKVEIEDASQMGKLASRLLKEGFSTDEVEKIFFKNAQRLIRDILGLSTPKNLEINTTLR